MVGNSRRSCGFQVESARQRTDGEDDGSRQISSHADAGCLGKWKQAMQCLLYMHTHLCHRALQQAVTCQLDYIHTRVLRACPIRNMYFIISVVDQSASPRTKTKTDGYHTLPAVLNNNNNNNSNPILSSRTTVVAWTHVIINPPHRDQAKAHGVCVSQASQASQRRSRQK